MDTIRKNQRHFFKLDLSLHQYIILKHIGVTFPACFWKFSFHLWVLIWTGSVQMLQYCWRKLYHICVGLGYGRSKGLRRHSAKHLQDCDQRTLWYNQREATGTNPERIDPLCHGNLGESRPSAKWGRAEYAAPGIWVGGRLPDFIHLPHSSEVLRLLLQPWQVWSKWKQIIPTSLGLLKLNWILNLSEVS